MNPLTDQSLVIDKVVGHGTVLGITRADKHISEYHWIWLRHQCTRDLCGTPLNAIRGIFIHDIPRDIVADVEH